MPFQKKPRVPSEFDFRVLPDRIDPPRHQQTLLPDTLSMPPAEQIVVEAFGYYPQHVELENATGTVQSIPLDLRPIPGVLSANAWSWAAIGLGLLSAVGAVAVEDAVEFHSATQKATIQWGLIGGGGGLFLTGVALQKWARKQHSDGQQSAH